MTKGLSYMVMLFGIALTIGSLGWGAGIPILIVILLLIAVISKKPE